MKTYWVVLWSLWAARLVRQPTLPVRVGGGWLRGEVAHDGTHRRYMAVPYASHPVKRFLGPGPEPSWRGVYDAIDEHIRCYQRFIPNWLVGQDDCLILNIYTPMDASESSKYPVIFYIHGGGFYEGSSSSALYGADYLVRKGVILVIINYRVQVQGFTCLRIKEAPGNAGMKDQVAAMRWVQRNIEVFGGDPNHVTLMGESAGATSVSFHLVSPMSKGLFHKAILQSGSSLGAWSIQFKPVRIGSFLVKAMGYDTEDPHEIYDILMKQSDFDLIMTRVPRKENNIIVSEVLHSPCVEKVIEGVEPFLTELPYEIFSRGEFHKVPMLSGTCSSEGLLFVSMENDTTLPNIRLEKSLPKHLKIPVEKRTEIGNRLMEFYLDGKNISHENLVNLSKFHGEVYFTMQVLEETQLMLELNNNPVYSYVFAYDGWRNIVKLSLMSYLSLARGATHADDLFYLFSQPFLSNLFEGKMIDRVTTMWTNFVKYGDPTPEVTDLLPVKWLPANKTNPHSLVIDREFSTTPLWSTDSLKYLRKIYAKYRRKKD